MGNPLERSDCLLIFIFFKVAFNQDFLISAGNMATSAKPLGSGMYCETSEPDLLNYAIQYLFQLQQT